ncbi:c-type cytochrome [Kordiimonas sp.]|uniref:c-type cytochrome n=1 Tax=Kordiimonas sp. TaxID=1970157 RepID=UPI003A934351
MKTSKLALLALFVVVLGTLMVFFKPGLSPDKATFTPTLQSGNSDLVSRGRVIYAGQCAACHGSNLEGQPNWRQRNLNGRLPAPPHDETGHTWHHPDAILFAITKYGPVALVGGSTYESDMPAYDGVLTDEEIVAVLSYIKSQWPEYIRMRHDQMN